MPDQDIQRYARTLNAPAWKFWVSSKAKREAARALGRSGNAEAVAPLLKALEATPFDEVVEAIAQLRQSPELCVQALGRAYAATSDELHRGRGELLLQAMAAFGEAAVEGIEYVVNRIYKDDRDPEKIIAIDERGETVAPNLPGATVTIGAGNTLQYRWAAEQGISPASMLAVNIDWDTRTYTVPLNRHATHDLLVKGTSDAAIKFISDLGHAGKAKGVCALFRCLEKEESIKLRSKIVEAIDALADEGIPLGAEDREAYRKFTADLSEFLDNQEKLAAVFPPMCRTVAAYMEVEPPLEDAEVLVEFKKVLKAALGPGDRIHAIILGTGDPA